MGKHGELIMAWIRQSECAGAIGKKTKLKRQNRKEKGEREEKRERGEKRKEKKRKAKRENEKRI